MKTLVIDIGGSNIKILATGAEERVKIPSGSDFSPEEMIPEVRKQASKWEYERVVMGFPGIVKNNTILTEPVNLGRGWETYDFEAAFGCTVKIINDAAMQALGSYEGKKMFFMGLGTGLGTAMVVNHSIIPMEAAHLPFRKATFETYLGKSYFQKHGVKKWEQQVHRAVKHFFRAFQPDEIVLGGGNSKHLSSIPDGCRLGTNKNAFKGGFRLFEEDFFI